MTRYNLLILLILFSSNSFAQDIVGTWKYDNTDSEVITTGDKLVADLIADNIKGQFKGSVFKFASDGKVYNGDAMGTYAISGDTIKDIQSGAGLKYSIADNTLTMELDLLNIQPEQFKKQGIEKLILKMHFKRFTED